MDFSESYRFSGPQPALSPDGNYIAAAVEGRLIVRNAVTTQVTQIYSCLDKIAQIAWCPNSVYVLCGLVKRSIVQVWSVHEPEWTCKIDEGLAGAERVCWSPDGLHVLVIADFQIRITIWSLTTKSFVYIAGPKHPDKGLSFSPDGKYMAVAEAPLVSLLKQQQQCGPAVQRKACKDIISMYTCSNWELVKQFQAATSDLEDIAWSPDAACLAAWDNCLTYNLTVCTPEGETLAKYSAYSNALGIKTVVWSPSGQMLIIGSFDQEARVLNHATWNPIAHLSHPAGVDGPTGVVAYKEIAEAPSSSVRLQPRKSRYILCEMPVKVPQQKVPLDKPNVRLGVGKTLWSKDGRYLVTYNENMASAVWIWDMQKFELMAVLLQIAKVKDLKWDPKQSRLLVCTGSSIVFLWSPEGASCIHVPLQDFEACSAQWSSDGSKLLLADRDAYCCAYWTNE